MNTSVNATGEGVQAASAASSSVYYDFFYKKSYLTYIIPMAIAFGVYYIIYIPYFKRLSYRVRNKMLT